MASFQNLFDHGRPLSRFHPGPTLQLSEQSLKLHEKQLLAGRPIIAVF